MTGHDTTAPGYDPEAVGLPWFRRSIRQGLGYFAPSSLFAFVPFFFADLPPVTTVLAVAATVLVLVFFLGSTLAVEWSETSRWLWLAGMISALLLTGLVTDGASRPAYFAPYVTAVAASLFPWRMARVLVVAGSLTTLALSLHERDTFGIVMAMMAFGIGWSVGSGIEGERVKLALRRAEERTAVLAVAAERERIGRDLHDILGHSLTTIAVKADLAARLVGRSDDSARAEIHELAEVARQALADVRSTASGMREVRLATEIAAARSVLGAAGVECRTPSAVPALDDARSGLFGYLVREAVTNVVRHSGASVCTITVDGSTISVADNGRGLASGARRSGLVGLADRLEAGGIQLSIASGPGGTTITGSVADVSVRAKEFT